ncbi:MAG: DUF3823 domain-containing protein [Williamsia sp.]|nr:DUF3823 domain-containing protein [Williamsia sp.]
MKTIQSIILLGSMLLIFAGCEKDNYDMPKGGIAGALVDAQNGGTLQLSETGANSTVRMLVNDPAKYPAPANYDLVVKQDGTFSNSSVFSESYKVFPVAQSGPWQYVAKDSVNVTVADNQTANVTFKVAPFYYISTPAVADSTVTFTITQSTMATVSNHLTNTNNLLILINNFERVDESICSNTAGKYYQNQFQFTITDAVLNTPYTPRGGTAASGNPYSFSFANMHMPHGTYYLRVAVFGNGSAGKFNYSPIVKITL